MDRPGTCIILDKKYNIANSSCHFGSYGSIWTGPYTAIWPVHIIFFWWRTGPYTAIWPSVPWTICYILTGLGQYNVFLILSELVFGLRYTITKNMSTDRFGSIEYNITNSSWHFGPNGSLWTGLSPTK